MTGNLDVIMLAAAAFASGIGIGGAVCTYLLPLCRPKPRPRLLLPLDPPRTETPNEDPDEEPRVPRREPQPRPTIAGIRHHVAGGARP